MEDQTESKSLFKAEKPLSPGQRWLVGLLYLWLIPFFLLSFFLILKVSISEPLIALPPYLPLVTWTLPEHLHINIYLGNIWDLLTEPLYGYSFYLSLQLAFATTLITLLIAYPLAYAMVQQPKHRQYLLLLLVMLPFWTSFLMRVYAWIGILSPTGIINSFLMWTGLISQPLALLHSVSGVLIGMVYCYLPFMILPLYAALEKFDWVLLQAAQDLGCRPIRAFFTITLPLTRNGIITGGMLVFIPAVGEFVIPTLLGGSTSTMVGKVLWDEFFFNRDWTMASMLAVGLLIVLFIPLIIIHRSLTKREKL